MVAVWQITITRDDITLLIAILGAVLGILNFTRGWWRNRVRLKVKPVFLTRHLFPSGKADLTMFFENRGGQKIPRVWGVEVMNKGVPVKIREVGFQLKGSSDRAALLRQISECFVALPHLLDRHDSVSIYADLIDDSGGYAHLGNFKRAYVRTTADQQFTGSTRAFKRAVKKCQH